MKIIKIAIMPRGIIHKEELGIITGPVPPIRRLYFSRY
jgi:hypothetical protein